MELIISAVVLLGVPLFMLYFFKSNVGMMFLAACTGLVLLDSLDPVVVTTAGAIVPGEGEAYVRLMTVLITMFVAGFVFRKVSSAGLKLLHSLIAVLLAATLWLTLPSVIGVSWLIDSQNSDVWQSANDFRTLIIATGFALSLVAVLHRPHKSSHHKSK